MLCRSSGYFFRQVLVQSHSNLARQATNGLRHGQFALHVVEDSHPSHFPINAYIGQVWYHTWHGAFYR